MRILEFPRDAALLRRKARPVRVEEYGTAPLLDFVRGLAQTMMDAGGMGLASTQVRESGPDPWAVFVLRVSREQWGAVCNPTIVQAEGESVEPEGCLSFASVTEPMSAPESVMVHGFNPKGAGFAAMWEGHLARCAFHETAHLRGELLIDRMAPLKRRMYLKNVARARVPKQPHGAL